MKVLVIGGGGREHALAWKVSQSPLVTKVFVAPGNAGTANEHKTENIEIDAEDIASLVSFAKQVEIGLCIVGPETPLVAGIVDEFRCQQIPIFGPSAVTAQLEGSKAFAKNFMRANKIPTGDYAVFTKFDEASDYIKSTTAPIVIKADGLAAGKGVIIAETHDEALICAKQMLSGDSFGKAGTQIVVEEYIQGEEASFICMVDGKHVLAMASSQDHKARDEGDVGPNTGGMGAYSPALIVDEKMHQRIIDEIINPTVNGFAKQGTPYTGFLYAGIMIDAKSDPYVLEFNCRFGDPETQPIMMRMQTDLAELCLAALDGKLDQKTIQWDKRPALGVVLASGGYPEKYEKGEIINGLSNTDELSIKVFHAGTKLQNGNVLTNGGRVLCVTALGDNIAEAKSQAYDLINKISWPNMYFRSDIGYRAIKK